MHGRNPARRSIAAVVRSIWLSCADADKDVIEFSDVASTALRLVERSGNNLIIHYGVSDQVTVMVSKGGATKDGTMDGSNSGNSDGFSY